MHVARILSLARRATTTRERLWAWVAHPAWLPRGVTETEPEIERATYAKYQPPVARRRRTYLIAQFALAGTALCVVLFFEHALSALQLAAAAGVLMASFVAAVGLSEGRRWAWRLEYTRLVAVVLVSSWLLS